jgi:hypothetical protein
MISTAHTLRRLASAIGLAALLAALAVPAALAKGPMLDTRDAVVQAQDLDPAIATAMAARRSSPASVARRSSDTLDPAIATAMSAHQSFATSFDRRSPDTRDAAIAAHQSAIASSDLRSPDTRDAAAKLNASLTTPVVTPVTSSDTSKGFEWGNLVIVLAVIGAFFVLVGFGGHALVTRQGRGGNRGSVAAG